MSAPIGQYDPMLLCVAATNILVYSAPDSKTKEAMRYTGLNQCDIAPDTYQKIIDKSKMKKLTPHLSHIEGLIDFLSFNSDNLF